MGDVGKQKEKGRKEERDRKQTETERENGNRKTQRKEGRKGGGREGDEGVGGSHNGHAAPANIRSAVELLVTVSELGSELPSPLPPPPPLPLPYPFPPSPLRRVLTPAYSASLTCSHLGT